MSPRWTKVLRDVWLHKSRTSLVVLAIAIGIVGAGAVLDTWSLLRRVTRDGYLATNPPSATLQVDSVDADLLLRVRALPSVADARARRTVIASVHSRGSWRTAVLFAANDLATTRIGRVERVSGSWPPADGAFTVEHSSVDFGEIAVGDSVALRLGDRAPVTVPVTGVARDGGLAPGWMEHVVYGFVTPATLARLGAPATLNQLQIVVRDGAMDREAIRRVAFEVRREVERSGHAVSDIEVPVPGRHIHAAQMDSLLYTQGAFGVLTLLLSGFLVVNLVTAMLAGQVREIGVMKAIGAGPSQVAGMYLALALFLGLVACAIAIPAAAFMGHKYADFSASLLNFELGGTQIPMGAFAAQVVVGALLPVVAAAFPVARGCRIPVSAALRDFGVTDQSHRTVRSGVLDRIGGLSRPLLLSLRNAFRRRQRMALTLITLAMGGAVVLGALNLRTSIRDATGLLYGTLMRFDLSVRFASPHAPDSLEAAARRVQGVRLAEAWSGARAATQGSDGMLHNTFPLTALPAASRLVKFPVVRGRWLNDGSAPEIVVNVRLMEDEPELTLGGSAILVVRGKPTRWTVVGVVESGPSPSAYASRAALAAVVGDDRAGTLIVAAAERGAAMQSELMQRLREGLEGGGLPVESGQLVQAGREAMEDHLLMVASFLVVMSQLMIVVGGLGLASTMSLAVLERTREIGVLRAIGARHVAIMTMLQVEGLVIAVSSWLIAIPLSVPMSVVLARAFARVMIPLPVTLVPELRGVLEWLGVVLVVSVLASAWPAWRASRVTTAAALAYE
jgi:putative ABC transport system permease protein